MKNWLSRELRPNSEQLSKENEHECNINLHTSKLTSRTLCRRWSRDPRRWAAPRCEHWGASCTLWWGYGRWSSRSPKTRTRAWTPANVIAGTDRLHEIQHSEKRILCTLCTVYTIHCKLVHVNGILVPNHRAWSAPRTGFSAGCRMTRTSSSVESIDSSCGY